MRRDLVAQFLDCENRLVAAVAGHQVLRLQFLAARRCKVHSKMRQPLEPWPWLPLLLRATFGVVSGQWMKLLRGQLRTKELRRPIVFIALRKTAFDPKLRAHMILPVCKNTHAVAARENLLEVCFQMRSEERRVGKECRSRW